MSVKIRVETMVNGHTKEAGLEICKHLGIDHARVLSINIFVLNRTLVVKTMDEVRKYQLVEDINAGGELIFRIGSCEVHKEPSWRARA